MMEENASGLRAWGHERTRGVQRMVSRFESRKDMAQELTESAAVRVGRIATIITSCVRDVTREVGDMLTDGLEMRDAARRARADAAGADEGAAGAGAAEDGEAGGRSGQ